MEARKNYYISCFGLFPFLDFLFRVRLALLNRTDLDRLKVSEFMPQGESSLSIHLEHVYIRQKRVCISRSKDLGAMLRHFRIEDEAT